MPIVVEVGTDIQEYVEFDLAMCIERPDGCMYCLVRGQMVAHGYYLRKPKDVGRGWVMRIRRWKCKACGKTVGAVPSFLLFFRHYVLRVIQSVFVQRFELEKSWSEVNLACADEGMPAMRTMQRWCVGLTEQAPGWLGAMEKTLAEHDSGSSWLDAQGEAGRFNHPARALLGASLHFLAWAKGRWREMAQYGLNDRLRFLWYWGNRQAALSRLA